MCLCAGISLGRHQNEQSSSVLFTAQHIKRCTHRAGRSSGNLGLAFPSCPCPCCSLLSGVVRQGVCVWPLSVQSFWDASTTHKPRQFIGVLHILNNVCKYIRIKYVGNCIWSSLSKIVIKSIFLWVKILDYTIFSSGPLIWLASGIPGRLIYSSKLQGCFAFVSFRSSAG